MRPRARHHPLRRPPGTGPPSSPASSSFASVSVVATTWRWSPASRGARRWSATERSSSGTARPSSSTTRSRRRRSSSRPRSIAEPQVHPMSSEQSVQPRSSFTDLFIRRPVIAIVVNLIIIIAGIQAIRTLNVRQYPRSENAVITVTTVYVGASADLVRGFITTPLERVIAAADGIDYLESTSAQGLSTINAHLRLNYDTTAALTQIQAKVAQFRNDLPPDAQIPVI